MAVESDADRSAFLDPDDFGVSAKILGCVFDAMRIPPYADVFNVEGNAPRLVCRTTDVSTTVSVAHGTAVEIGTATYTVRGIQPDGEGMTTLILESP